MMAPEQLKEIPGLPELMRFEDGERVLTASDWERRREEILRLYSEFMYGFMPERQGEKVSFSLEKDEETGGTLLRVSVSARGRKADFPVLVGLPSSPAPEGGYPVFIEYMPWHYRHWVTKEWVTGFSDSCRFAMERGYAAVQYDPSRVALDSASYSGAFYALYPWGESDPVEQRGVLLAWAWGVSRVIDALENGAGERLKICPGKAIVAGVSRFGKSAAVAGAYDRRVRVTVPSCSGAGGVAVFRMGNQGKTYRLNGPAGEEYWTNGSQNEPFSHLQGGEGYWFCGNFRRVPSPRHLPVDQHMLCALAAGRDRHLIVVTGVVSEGWNNTEGQCLAYVKAKPAWDLLGRGDNIGMIVHRDGHAILPSDMETILDYCDERLLGLPRGKSRFDPESLKAAFFLRDNRDVLDPLFAEN